MNKLLFILFICLSGCAGRSQKVDPDHITSMQVVDRNGFSETISNKDRLTAYQTVDFTSNQPYQKVLRVFGRDPEGKTHSKITSYHPNGQICQYLEVMDGRAHGKYKEWHENGALKIECTVIEGMADVGPLAQTGWLFEGESKVWDEEGHLIAIIHYEKGALQGLSNYYYPNGQPWKSVPYERDLIEGEMLVYNENGELSQKIPFKKGVSSGVAVGHWTKDLLWYEEHYQEGLLFKALYYDPTGKLTSEIKNGEGTLALFVNAHLESLIQYKNGKPEGEVKLFDSNGKVNKIFSIKDEKKHGEEWQYFPNTEQAKLLVSWYEDHIQGLVKTWYENGMLESQREMSNNKKHGLSFAYYKDGQLMFMEEYDHDKLMRGSYFKKGEKLPVSKIENGHGVATLYNAEGHLNQKVNYEKGNPLID